MFCLPLEGIRFVKMATYINCTKYIQSNNNLNGLNDTASLIIKTAESK